MPNVLWQPARQQRASQAQSDVEVESCRKSAEESRNGGAERKGAAEYLTNHWGRMTGVS